MNRENQSDLHSLIVEEVKVHPEEDTVTSLRPSWKFKLFITIYLFIILILSVHILNFYLYRVSQKTVYTLFLGIFRLPRQLQ